MTDERLPGEPEDFYVVEQDVRTAYFRNLIQRFIDLFPEDSPLREVFSIDFRKEEVVDPISVLDGKYDISKTVSKDHLEIVVARNAFEDRPNVSQEHLKFRINNSTFALENIVVEYSRTLRKPEGSRRVLTGEPGERSANKFMVRFEQDARTIGGKV